MPSYEEALKLELQAILDLSCRLQKRIEKLTKLVGGVKKRRTRGPTHGVSWAAFFAKHAGLTVDGHRIAKLTKCSLIAAHQAIHQAKKRGQLVQLELGVYRVLTEKEMNS